MRKFKNNFQWSLKGNICMQITKKFLKPSIDLFAS